MVYFNYDLPAAQPDRNRWVRETALSLIDLLEGFVLATELQPITEARGDRWDDVPLPPEGVGAAAAAALGRHHDLIGVGVTLAPLLVDEPGGPVRPRPGGGRLVLDLGTDVETGADDPYLDLRIDVEDYYAEWTYARDRDNRTLARANAPRVSAFLRAVQDRLGAVFHEAGDGYSGQIGPDGFQPLDGPSATDHPLAAALLVTFDNPDLDTDYGDEPDAAVDRFLDSRAADTAVAMEEDLGRLRTALATLSEEAALTSLYALGCRLRPPAIRHTADSFLAQLQRHAAQWVVMFAEHLTEPTFRCVGFLDPKQSARVDVGLPATGLQVATVDARSLLTDDDLLTAVGVAFSFPDYYGHNYNALIDCLRDLSWLPAPGYVLRVRDAGTLWREAPEVAGHFAEIWLLCAENWASPPEPRSFHLLFVW